MHRLLALLVGVTAVISDDANEERILASGRKLIVVNVHRNPSHWFLIAETSAIVVENLGRNVLAMSYAKHGNLVFYQTGMSNPIGFDGYEENYEAFEEALEYTYTNMGAPIVVSYSGAGNVALRCLNKAHLRHKARLLMYTAGPGMDLSTTMHKNIDWVQNRMEGTVYSVLSSLVSNPMDSTLPVVQFTTNVMWTVLMGGFKYRCFVAGVLCVEMLTGDAGSVGSLSAIALNIHTTPPRFIQDFLQYPEWYRGWTDAVQTLDDYAADAPPIYAIHGSHDRLFDRETTFRSLESRVAAPLKNCTVTEAAHVLYGENPAGLEVCILDALTQITG